jgi:hypothetical protein
MSPSPIPRLAVLALTPSVRATSSTVESGWSVRRGGAGLHAVLRDRAADLLRKAAQAIGCRTGLQAASLIAVSPHASWMV